MDRPVLVIPLTGKIDSANAAVVGQEVARLRAEQEHRVLVFDAKALSYISSAGLRVLMQAVKEEKVQKHEPVSIVEVSREVYDILDMTGFTEFMKVEKVFREISLEGSELIAQGFFGKVYRLDEETIVKVYGEGADSIPLIKKEQSRARKAFVKGLPTAISYDIVRVGEQYGAVFELLQARSFNDWAQDYEKQPEKIEELLQLYVDCLKQVHATELDRGELPLARDIMLENLGSLQDCLPAESISRIKRLLQALPDDFHVVHGDFQMKNVLLCDGEPMLIDMESLCTGQPLFDLQGLYVTYKAFPEDEPGNAMNFLGIQDGTAAYIWQRLMELYFGTEDKTVLGRMEDKIRVVAAVRFLYLLTVTGLKHHDLTPRRIQHTREQLAELLSRVDSLELK